MAAGKAAAKFWTCLASMEYAPSAHGLSLPPAAPLAGVGSAAADVGQSGRGLGPDVGYHSLQGALHSPALGRQAVLLGQGFARIIASPAQPGGIRASPV